MDLKDMKVIQAVLKGEVVEPKELDITMQKVDILVQQGTLQEEFTAKMNELRNIFDEIK